MKNKHVGYLIVFIASLIGLIIYIFNSALKDIVAESCTHGPICTMWTTIDIQTNISLGLMFFIYVIGFCLIFFSNDGEPKVVKVKKKKDLTLKDFDENFPELTSEEKDVLEKVLNEKGTIFQSELSDKTNYSRVKITRILDKLEGKNIISRRKRGMTNVVILKHQEE